MRSGTAERRDVGGGGPLRRLGLKVLAIVVTLAFPAALPVLARAQTGDPEILLPSIPSQSNGTTFSGQVATLVTGGQTDLPSGWTISIKWGDGTTPDTTTATVTGGSCQAVPPGGTYILTDACGEENNGLRSGLYRDDEWPHLPGVRPVLVLADGQWQLHRRDSI